MTKKEKKIIFGAIAIVAIVLLIVVFTKSGGKEKNVQTNIAQNSGSTTNTVKNEEKYVTELSDGTKLNNSDDLKTGKQYKNLQISEIQVTSNSGNSVILADVKNSSGANFEKEIVHLTLYGDNNEIITEFDAIMPAIEAGGTGQLNAMVTADIANVKDFKIEAK